MIADAETLLLCYDAKFSIKYSPQLSPSSLVLVLLDARRVEDGSVVLADADVGALVLVL